jgi:hypothetical protein
MSNAAALATIKEAEKELAQLDVVYNELLTDAGLTAASMAPPPVGTVADVVSIGRSLSQGDWGGALLDVVGIIPIVGDGIKGASKGTKIAAKMKDVKIALDTARAKLARKKQALMTDAKGQEAKTNKALKNCNVQPCPGGRGGKKDQVKKIPKLKCFKPGKQVKDGFDERHPSGKTLEGRTLDQEFNRQLKNQESGINAMSPEDLIEGIDKYKGVRDPKKANEIREHYKKKIFTKKSKELESSGLSPDAMEKQANEYADNAAKQVAALHNPDGIAGGKDKFDSKNLDKHIGDKGVNSSLGSQWRGERTEALKKEAEESLKKGDKKMNTKLKRCK